jgi:hypothetical protein
VSAYGLSPYEGDWLLWGDDDPDSGLDLTRGQVASLAAALEAGFPHGWCSDGASAELYGGDLGVSWCEVTVVISAPIAEIAATLREALR